MDEQLALTGNAADVDDVALAKWLAEEEERERRARWRLQLNSKEGRAFLWREIFEEIFQYIAPGDEQRLGVRNKELRWWAFANENPELFLQMQREAMKDATRRNERVKAARTKRAADTKA